MFERVVWGWQHVACKMNHAARLAVVMLTHVAAADWLVRGEAFCDWSLLVSFASPLREN